MSDPRPWGERVLAALDLCEREFEDRNAHASAELTEKFAQLKQRLSRGRRPRVVAIGRRGSGKSSLLNALAASQRTDVGDVKDATPALHWHELSLGGRLVDWGDSPGLRAAAQPDRRDIVARGLVLTPPDVVLLVCQATEVDAGIDDDLADVAFVLRAMAHAKVDKPALFGVVTKVDELAPPDVMTPPFADDEKARNIEHAVRLFDAHSRRHGIETEWNVAVAAYARFDGETVVDALQWNLGVLARRIEERLPSDEQIRATKSVRELRALLDSVVDGIVEAFVQLAKHSHAGPSRDGDVVVAELSMVRAAMERVLRLLAPAPEQLPEEPAGALRPPDGALEWVRSALTVVGASSVGGAVAGMQLRAEGVALKRRILEGLSESMA